MLRTIKRLFTGKQEQEPVAPVDIAPDPRGAPGTRVYHEYFVDDEPTNGVYGWLCRVYAQNGAPTEQHGTSATREGARNAALSWAATTKRALRGES